MKVSRLIGVFAALAVISAFASFAALAQPHDPIPIVDELVSSSLDFAGMVGSTFYAVAAVAAIVVGAVLAIAMMARAWRMFFGRPYRTLHFANGRTSRRRDPGWKDGPSFYW